MFNENFTHGSMFTVDSSDFPFVSLKEIVTENGHQTLKVDGVFTFYSTKAKKNRPVLVADGHKINLPDHCLKDVIKIMENPEYIKAINEGHCGFKTTEYEDTNFGHGTCYSGLFVDI
ncbi:MAG: hypothetical protein J6S85_20320 [Methanobrevibacter sp.]|nr:hypothetical protein [Methanobrevibacter sp.]